MLREAVARRLAQRWSPSQISRWSQRRYSQRTTWHVCAETIYDGVYRACPPRRRPPSRQGAMGVYDASPWLFPGGQPGRPISAYQLAQRLRQLGLHPGQARCTALFQLATDLPAAVLARMLGIHISVAIAWQRASSGDWTHYAAELSRHS
ncbi:MAG: hypothetical protein ACJ72N_25005 [Labedaea sp.]